MQWPWGWLLYQEGAMGFHFPGAVCSVPACCAPLACIANSTHSGVTIPGYSRSLRSSGPARPLEPKLVLRGYQLGLSKMPTQVCWPLAPCAGCLGPERDQNYANGTVTRHGPSTPTCAWQVPWKPCLTLAKHNYSFWSVAPALYLETTQRHDLPDRGHERVVRVR